MCDQDFGCKEPAYITKQGKEDLLKRLCGLPQDTLCDKAQVLPEDRETFQKAIQNYAKKHNLQLV
jgi:hypothetical protein